MQNRYPKLIIDLDKLRHNIEEIQKVCRKQGVETVGVVKGCSGLWECVRQFENAGCSFIASSRIEQLEYFKEKGIQTSLMIIRIPMISEAADVVRTADISLNSEVSVLKELDKQARIQDKKHKVILMIDLGDLREGFWGTDDLISAAIMVENELHNLELVGVGTNLGCYGSVTSTVEKMEELVAAAETVENVIGRELEIISGGSGNGLPRIFEEDMPARVNQLRIGESILLARDMQDLWGYDLPFLHKDVFTLQAEVIEVKVKPTYPVGEIAYDAFSHKCEYEDRGIRKRALLGVGRIDYGDITEIIPRVSGIEIIGASSDHTIIDIEDYEGDLKVGDILEFDMIYSAMVYACSSNNVNKVYSSKKS